MSDASEEPPLDLDSVAEPAIPPPNVPDDRTREEVEEERQEISLIKELASKPALRSVFVSERENVRLKKELDDANTERRNLQDRVFGLGPENAVLKQSMHDMRGNFTIAALLLTGGSTSESIAGAISDQTWKPITLIAGITASIIGLVLTIYTFFLINPGSSSDQRKRV